MADVKKAATRASYGEALVELGAEHDDFVVFDADLAEATHTATFKKAYPERFFDAGIAEGNMMGLAAGVATTGRKAFASTFAMFAAGRAYEQVRNSIGYPHLNVKIGATHAGISVGEDGATHQCNEDIALMRTIPGMTIINPADAVEARAAVKAAIDMKGPVYLRFGRYAVPVIHDDSYHFEIGRGEELCDGKDVSIVATGLCVSMALEAAELLAAEGGDRRAADADKQAADLQLPAVLQADAGQALTAQQLRYGAVPAERHIALFFQRRQPGGRCPERAAAVHERHMAAQSRQQQGFADGGIAAADHGDVLPAEKRPVAGGAVAHAVQLVLLRQPEPPRARSRGEHNGPGKDRPAVRLQLLYAAGELRAADVGQQKNGSRALRTCLHAVCQRGSVCAVRKAGVILNVLRLRHLPAGAEPLENEHVQPGAGGIESRRAARRSGPDHGHVIASHASPLRRNSSSSVSVFAPVVRRSSLPERNSSSVGTVSTSNRAASSGWASTSTFPMRSSGRASASASSTGASARHGPHHAAKRSTSTGPSACRTSCPKFSSVKGKIGIKITPFGA